MNYIHQLQARVKHLEQVVADSKAEMADLRSYLYSDKFNVHDYVYCTDVLNRLLNVSRALDRAED